MVSAIRYGLLLLLSLACVHAAEVQLLLDSNRIATGEGAHLTIQIRGGNAQRPTIPEVPNLIVDYQAQNQMFSMVNGATTQIVSFQYLVGSQVAGEYMIPPIVVKVAGQELTTQPQKLTVFDDGSHAAQGNAGQPAPPDPHRFSMMTVALAVPERQDIYLGEIAPVRIEAWFPADARVQLRSMIQPESGSYTLHNLSNQPQQTSQQKDGKSYNVLTWFGGISATKEGAQAVKLSMKVMVALPDLSKPVLRPRAGNASPLHPFGRGAGMRYSEEEVTLVSEPMSLQVRPLPEEGRPANFSGAVGEFAFDALEIPAAWNTGEPQRVALRIRGSGNFANMKAPELSPADLWKWYPGQDQFTPSDIASFSGSKVFQYNAIARKSGEYPVAFELSYFDPKLGTYQLIRSEERRVNITGDNIIEEKSAPAIAAVPPPPPAEDGPSPLRQRAATSWTSAAWTRGINLTLVAGLATLLAAAAPVFALWRKTSLDPARLHRLQQQREIQAAMKRKQQAERDADAAAYWTAALEAMRLSLSASWRMPAHAISLHDVTQRCGVDSAVTAFFREADRWTYGAHHSAPDWSHWRTLDQQALAALNS